ncbi:ankyrin repeat domain-containing protein [Wolbachia endosymbiont of Armadillidium arcangelii]|uniref:Ankyrin repeat domain-containing protein n=1 Tax=Wolbachia endosymbiont of Armadillidium arcangelii TaxID=3158571 RepID=A0AAU7Q550_9RICK
MLLHDAVREGCLDLVSALLNQGVGVNIQDNDGDTALHFANLNNNVEIQALLQAAEPNGNMNNVNMENLYGPGMGR